MVLLANTLINMETGTVVCELASYSEQVKASECRFSVWMNVEGKMDPGRTVWGRRGLGVWDRQGERIPVLKTLLSQ